MRLALLLCLITAPALAESVKRATSPAIARLETGVICPPPAVGVSEAPDTVAGTTHLIDEDPPFISNGHQVPAVMGIGFGAKAMAQASLGIDNITMTVTHPPMGADGVTEQRFLTRISGLDTSLTFYQFDHSYEVLVGTWTMTASKDGELLYQTSFEVVPPQKLPELAAACGFENLLS